jgi:hypothetical protein
MLYESTFHYCDGFANRSDLNESQATVIEFSGHRKLEGVWIVTSAISRSSCRRWPRPILEHHSRDRTSTLAVMMVDRLAVAIA